MGLGFDWGIHKSNKVLDLFPSEKLWEWFYATNDDEYAERIAAILRVRGEIK